MKAEPPFCAEELDAVRELVPVLGIRATARRLDRDPRAVHRHANRMGVRSLFCERPWSKNS